jgi:CheY-like chemotaxis protein
MRPARRRARHSRPTVLIVDEDRILAEAAAEAIEAGGYRAVWARNAHEALAALEQERPALLLFDPSLPGMSGSELSRSVRDSPTWARIPRVIMTGTNDPMIGIREDAPVLYKPLDLDALVAIVQRYCDRSWPQVTAFIERHS